MKKKYMTLVLLVVAAIVITSVISGLKVWGAERIPGESSLYTNWQVRTAMNAAIRKFQWNYKDCKLLRIAYDEEETLKEREYQMERNGRDRVIVFVSDFHVGSHGETCFNLNETYRNWKWILEKSAFGWKVIGSGYA